MNKDTIAVLHALEAENDWLREQAEVATALAERATTDAVVATKLYEAASKRADVAERQAEALAGALAEIERETERVNTRRGSRNGRIREVAQAALRAFREANHE